MFDIKERIINIEKLIQETAVELVHEEAKYAKVEITKSEIKVSQYFACIFGCWWTSYEIYFDADGFVTYSYFGDHDYPRSKELQRNIGFEKAVLKILRENL